MKIAFVSKTRTRNVGDLFSDVKRYFEVPKGMETEAFDSDDLWEESDAEVFVFGGGGMLHGEWTGRMNDFAFGGGKERKLVAWGIGINGHGETKRVWPKFLDEFDLVGLRDWDSPWRFVPCVSCLNKVFDRRLKEPKNETVVFNHREFPTGLDLLPSMENHEVSLGKVIKFLGSAREVVTSSYHGAYWSLLLGKRVKVERFWSNKFQGLVREPERLPEGFSEEGYLEKCRRLNLGFMEEMKGLLA